MLLYTAPSAYGVDPVLRLNQTGNGVFSCEEEGSGDSADVLDDDNEASYESFCTAYFGAMLWSEELDEVDIGSIAPDLRATSRRECLDFFENYGHLFEEDIERAGMDFWLSRNGHGSGFFDGPYKEARQLQAAARVYGSVYVYYDEEAGLLRS